MKILQDRYESLIEATKQKETAIAEELLAAEAVHMADLARIGEQRVIITELSVSKNKLQEERERNIILFKQKVNQCEEDRKNALQAKKDAVDELVRV